MAEISFASRSSNPRLWLAGGWLLRWWWFGLGVCWRGRGLRSTRWRRSVLTLLLRSDRLRKIFFQQRLKQQNDDEGRKKDHQQLALTARFRLRILIFSQS